MLVDWTQEFILLCPLPLIVAANLADVRGARSSAWAAAGRITLLAAPAAALVLGLADVAAAPLAGPRSATAYALAGAGFAAAGLVGIAVQFEPAVGWAARVLPLNTASCVHRLALVLSAEIVVAQLTTQLTTDVLTAQAAAGASLSRLDLVAQEIPFLAAGFLGVGLWVRRGPRAALARLGLVRPVAWQVLGALAAAGLFYAFGTGVDRLAEAVTPDVARKVQAATERLFGHLADPAGIATVAVAAGVCEETLFRGALQPRLGLLWVAIVFTSVHTQYGLTLDAAAVLVLACGLGLLRRYANTTTSLTCHIAYNALVGFGLGGLGIVPAVAAEVLVVAAAGAAYALARRSPGGRTPSS